MCVVKAPLLFLAGVILCASGLAAELDPDQLAYNLKTTAEAYEKVGRKNPKWDADAKSCLTAFAQMRSAAKGAGTQFQDKVRAVVPRLVEDKCDDPLIGYLRCRFALSGSEADVADAYAISAGALQRSEYPEIRKFYALMWACRWRANSNLLEQATEALAKALADDSMPEREADESSEFLLSFPWWADGSRWNSYHTLEPALTNRWKKASFAFLAKGRGYLSYAWQARGTGYANTVTERGAELFTERLAIAASALEAAWDGNPHDARICREMMRVELGQGKGRERLETWFQRGMRLEPSNTDLCYEKLEYLRPRWYGSVKEMIDFGRECTANTNWSGGVRLMLADAHYEASREIQDKEERAAYWKQPNVWKDVAFAYEQFFKLYPQEVGYRYNYAMYASRCGQWQEFLTQVKLFPSTNYAYFGGMDRFNEMVRYAQEHVKQK